MRKLRFLSISWQRHRVYSSLHCICQKCVCGGGMKVKTDSTGLANFDGGARACFTNSLLLLRRLLRWNGSITAEIESERGDAAMKQRVARVSLRSMKMIMTFACLGADIIRLAKYGGAVVAICMKSTRTWVRFAKLDAKSFYVSRGAGSNGLWELIHGWHFFLFCGGKVLF